MSVDRPVERSVFRRLAVITTVMAIVILVILTLFFWLTVAPQFNDPELNRRLRRSHFLLVGPTMAVIMGVVLIAHVLLLRMLRPLRALAEGVGRLTHGDLDVVINGSSRDEFATLTDGFNQMVARVREMIGARDQLLLDVSHELRSPITRMKVALELVPDSDAKMRLMADVREMESMVTELLELERLRDGRSVRKERIDVALLARNVAASFAGRHPEVHVVGSVERVDVDADVRMVTILIRNLIENAVTHSLADSGPVDVEISRRGDAVHISISDDGPGLPEAEAAHVFEPFYRVDRSRSRRTGGYGLGLSICKRVADSHGGRIDVTPRRPRGTRFIVSMPAA